MRLFTSSRAYLLLVAACFLLPGAGCARAPHNTSTGVRMQVTLRMGGPVNDNYQYFFLIRNAADASGQNGPIPVILPPYLNGFATGQNSSTAGFTDFVEYSRVQRQPTASGYAVYHLPGGISGEPNNNVFAARGAPEYTVTPNGSSTLRFDLDLSRLQPDAGEPDPNTGQTPRYLQMNVVATTTTPIDPANIDPSKVIDSFGDQRLGSGTFNTFLTVDTLQTRIYQSSTSPGDPLYEPEHDPYPSDRDPAVDLISWSVQFLGR